MTADYPVAYREDTGVETRILCIDCAQGSMDVLCDDHPDARDWYTELSEDEVDRDAVCGECGEPIFDREETDA